MSTKNLTLIVIVGLILLLGGCGCSSYNTMNGLKQQANEAFSNVDNQYKRRSDLIGNLVNTVKGAANFEKETLTQVIQARASATSIKVDPNDLTPEKMQQFQAAQGQLSQALGRLMVVSERYPELKATQAFANLQTELSSTENKIATERSRYNEVVKNYNTKITNFPNVIYAGMLGFKERGFFQATDAEKTVPNVDFSK
ncbi:MAG: LemA family protein [Bacteroidota bacterium]